MSANAAIIERVRKLLALGAAGSGATEAEAASAMSMAAALMARHNIEEDALRPKGTKARVTDDTFEGIDELWHRHAATAAAKLNFCDIYFRGEQAVFIGRETNVAAAKILVASIIAQIERLYKEALPRGMTKADRAEFRRTFKFAAAGRVHGRVVQILEGLRNNDAKAIEATGSRALVIVQSIDEQLREAAEYLKQSGVQLAVRKHRPTKAGQGTAAGRQAGERVKLQDSVR